ncbi:porin family protein [Rubripirellula reticaptiva]|uniref:Phosphate-selective porin O and P n=1 Tax=Rubripirellula reticaptiva TaxID=2528013 RepID=A0A5C6F9X9_9BACT|nr:hypothetical protein [Rubripirellula reticaptiva]TWU56341.1 Phosphate-selective porin O and P [Rubripirellula reticaptiva]
MSRNAKNRLLGTCLFALAILQATCGFSESATSVFPTEPGQGEQNASNLAPTSKFGGLALCDPVLVESVLPFDVEPAYPSENAPIHLDYFESADQLQNDAFLRPISIGVGYDEGFIIASEGDSTVGEAQFPYRLKINGWGQLRDTTFHSNGSNRDLNQLQLKRARVVLSGNAFSTDLSYFVQFDGRSNVADSIRILDYYFSYDVGRHLWSASPGTFGIRAGLYKMPSSLARQLSGKELQFADRSMSSIYFDVNRSLAFGLYGTVQALSKPVRWELAVFNGLVSGGAETGSSGALDNNNAFSGRVESYPTGEWGPGQLADLSHHGNLATRVGAGFATTTIDRSGSTEFSSLRTVDAGLQLVSLLPASVNSYDVAQYSVDGSMKYRGLSLTMEYYFRNISGFRGGEVADLFDHGFWLQSGIFLVPRKLELLSRWSRITGNSGTLGSVNQSSDEISGGGVWYFRDQHAKITMDATYLNGAAINSSVLDISRGDIGWLLRTQLQFSF